MPASTPPPDCDLHCKPARGSYRISLKKFCRKDYGRPPALTFSPCPFPPWASHCRLPRPVSSRWPLDAYPHPSVECPLCASLSTPRARRVPTRRPPPHGSAPLDPAPSRPPRSGAGGGRRARRGARLVDALPGGRACSVPERRGAREAREQRAVGAGAGRGLWLPAPATGPPLPATWGRARDRGRRPGARAQRHPREPRAALARCVDAAPAEAAAA